MEQTRQGTGQQKGALRVLVMESDAITRQYAQRALNEMGYSVSPVATSAEAIGFFRIALEQRRPYSAVILTVELDDDLEISETLEQLRSMDPRVRAIVTGSDPNHPFISEYRRYGYENRLLKPYSESELQTVLLKESRDN